MRSVEKMWKKARKSLRKKCGEKSGKVLVLEFSTTNEIVFHNLNETVGKFSRCFTHKSTGVKSGFYTIST